MLGSPCTITFTSSIARATWDEIFGEIAAVVVSFTSFSRISCTIHIGQVWDHPFLDSSCWSTFKIITTGWSVLHFLWDVIHVLTSPFIWKDTNMPPSSSFPFPFSCRGAALLVSLAIYAAFSSILEILRQVHRLTSELFSSIYEILSYILWEEIWCTCATFYFFSAIISSACWRLSRLVSSVF